MKITSLVCPSCGATLEIKEIKRITKCFCQYCGHTFLLEDERAAVPETIKIEGISTEEDLLQSAGELLEIGDYLPALDKFKQYTAKKSGDFRGWLGLLRARTREFSVFDQNSLFRIDIRKYYENYAASAPADVLAQYDQVINEYFHPEIKAARLKAEAKQDKLVRKDKKAELKQRMKELKQTARGGSGGLFAKFR